MCLSSVKELQLCALLYCCALEGLTCLASFMDTNSPSLLDASSAAVRFCCAFPYVSPAEIFALINLAFLNITYATMGTLRIDPLYGLCSLQDLSVHAPGANTLMVTPELQALIYLTSLSLSASGCEDEGKKSSQHRLEGHEFDAEIGHTLHWQISGSSELSLTLLLYPT